MITTTVEHNLNAFNARLAQYQAVSGKTSQEVLLKQGNKLGYELAYRLRALAPAKGSVREERLAALARGGGLRLRQSIRESAAPGLNGAYSRLSDRKMVTKNSKGKERVIKWALGEDGKLLSWYQLAIRKELALRESGRGYTGLAGRLRTDNLASGGTNTLKGRYSQELAKVGLSGPADAATLTFTWGGFAQNSELGDSLKQPRARQALAEALAAVTKDMGVYLAKRHVEKLKETLKA